MEANKPAGSSSSLTSELLGAKQSKPSSSSGIFASLFDPSPKVLERESIHSEVRGKTDTEPWSSKIGTPVLFLYTDGTYLGHDDETQSTENKNMSPIYEEQRVQPCHFSSSIYYGGRDEYFDPQSTQNAELKSLYKKDSVEDDSGSASRGNWWQGSLYY